MNMPELVLLLTGVLGLGALGLALLLQRRLRALQARVAALEQALQQNAEWYQSLSEGALGQGRHLARLREDLDRLKARIEEVAVSDPAGSAFGQAIRMARRGSAAGEIVEACGLSRVEADLVVLLHRSEQAP